MTPLKKALKTNAIMTWIFVGIVLTFFILYLVIGKLWLLAIGLILIISVFGNIHDRKRIRRSYCPYCEEQYDYDNDVAWECSNVITGTQKQKADVEIECKCSRCNAATSFVKTFVTGELDTLGRVKEYNLYNLVRKYFKM